MEYSDWLNAVADLLGRELKHSEYLYSKYMLGLTPSEVAESCMIAA